MSASRIYHVTDPKAGTERLIRAVSPAPAGRGVAARDGLEVMRRRWTPGEDRVLRELYAITITSEIAQRLARPASSVYKRAGLLGLSKSPEFFEPDSSGRMRKGRAFRGVAYRFPKGHVPANKGQRGFRASPATEFKPGQRGSKWLPIGSLRTSKEGYLQRKMTDTGYPPRDWVAVHRLVWIDAHGPIPEGHAVAFLPGRFSAEASTITPDALELVSRAELMRRNTIHRMPKELVDLARLRGVLNRTIHDKEKAR